MTAYEFVAREKVHHAVRALCRALGVSPSGYYTWRTRGPSARARADECVAAQVAMIHCAVEGRMGRRASVPNLPQRARAAAARAWRGL